MQLKYFTVYLYVLSVSCSSCQPQSNLNTSAENEQEWQLEWENFSFPDLCFDEDRQYVVKRSEWGIFNHFDTNAVLKSRYRDDEAFLTYLLYEATTVEWLAVTCPLEIYTADEFDRIYLAKFYLSMGANPNAIDARTDCSIISKALMSGNGNEQLAFFLATATNYKYSATAATVSNALETARTFDRSLFISLMEANESIDKLPEVDVSWRAIDLDSREKRQR